MDLKSGYYQISIQDIDQEKTAFVTQDGLYQFRVLPMGLMNSPATFQRIMNNILGHNRWDYVVIYLDDILIFSKSFTEHMKHLAKILTVLQRHQFTLNPDKCSVATQTVEFLSHIITKDSIIPSKDRIQAIIDIPQPKTIAQANRFIGKIGWYRKFIPHFAQVAAPIHKVTNKTKLKKHEFYWGAEQIAAVDKLKQTLINEPLVLKHPHPTAPFLLATDASHYAIGGTLKQLVNGKIHYNYFLSRLLTATEKNYSTIEREALAIFWCMSQLEQYLGGREVTVYTDHKPLVGFHRKLNSYSKRIGNWLIKYQEMIHQIKDILYRKGRNHGDADGMSRPEMETQQRLQVMTRSMTKVKHCPSSSIPMEVTVKPRGNQVYKSILEKFDLSLEHIREEQCRDPLVAKIKTELISKHTNDYILEEDVLYKCINRSSECATRKLIYIPKSLQDQVLKLYHDHPTAAHFGFHRTWSKLRNLCYWRGIRASIHTYIQSCEKCAQFNIRRTKAPGHLKPIEYPSGPLELVSMDYWGPTSFGTPNGNKYVLVIIDHFTKYVVAMALPDNTATTTTKCFVEQFIFKFGIPRRLITDRGVHFNNELMTNVTSLLGAHHIKTTVYHPQANGLVERFNGTFHPQLAKLYHAEINDWDDHLAAVIYAYNTGQQSSTGYSPFQLMFVRNPILPLEHTPDTFRFTRPNAYWNHLMRIMDTYRKNARNHVKDFQRRSKERFDKNRQEFQYDEHDLVLWKVPGHIRKFDERFTGPYRIIKKQHPTYTIQDSNSMAVKHVHINALKSIVTRTN